jgi:6-pyruvoyltetrahydropterin/6-carboxytetrahydropterin synthase
MCRSAPITATMSAPNAELYYTAATPFEAARHIPILPATHRSARMHGHGFLARIRTRLPAGWASVAGTESDALEAHLREQVAPLDYRLLNDIVAVPTDENLARWLRARLGLRVVDRVGIQSARDQGVDLDVADRAHLWHRFRFEAAHRLPNVAPDHPCGRMHGHGFEVIVHVRVPLDGADIGVDFDEIARCWAPLRAQLHANCLNEIVGLDNPTSEHIAAWLWQRLQPALPALSWVTVYETTTAGCHYDGAGYRIWKERRFEAATQLSAPPAGDTRGRLHGHSYIARLHLSAPLDTVLGWTLDYGDVKQRFEPLYRQLDHHDLRDGRTEAEGVFQGVVALDHQTPCRHDLVVIAPVHD